ncbi:MAG: hypothetical protein R3B96_10265 [Pirellulaceae bacterium]
MRENEKRAGVTEGVREPRRDDPTSRSPTSRLAHPNQAGGLTSGAGFRLGE